MFAEARRSQMLLGLFGYASTGVLVNRVVPSGSDDPLVAAWRSAQRDVLEELGDTFGEIPRLSVPWRAHEPVGPAALDELYVRVGGYTRNLVLLAGFSDRRVTAATVERDWLRIEFAAACASAVTGVGPADV